MNKRQKKKNAYKYFGLARSLDYGITKRKYLATWYYLKPELFQYVKNKKLKCSIRKDSKNPEYNECLRSGFIGVSGDMMDWFLTRYKLSEKFYRGYTALPGPVQTGTMQDILNTTNRVIWIEHFDWMARYKNS